VLETEPHPLLESRPVRVCFVADRLGVGATERQFVSDPEIVAGTMKIAHLTASRFFGGPERQMLQLAASLPAGTATLFASFCEGGRCEAFLNKARDCGFEGVELLHDTPRLVAAWQELVELLRRRPEEILVCHGYKANLVGLSAARAVGIPVVSVSRGWTGETGRVRLYDWIDRRVLRWMDRVVCVSHAQAEKVRRAGVAPRKIAVIHNAIDVARFDRASPADHRPRLEGLFATPPRRIVGAAGRLSPEKGFDVLVNAAAHVVSTDPSVGFVLFGEGRRRDALAAQIGARGLDRHVVLAGFREDLDWFFPHLDLFVLPSFTEGLPNVALEAFAAGVPVVATAVGGTPEVVDDGTSGRLVPPGNPAAMARAILEVLSDEARRLQMGARGRERVRRHFTFASQARAYQELFDRLVPRKSGKSHRAPESSSTIARGRGARRAVRDDTNRDHNGGILSRQRLDRPVRVCFVIERLGIGGTERQLLALIGGLNRSRVQPYLCLLDGSDELSRSLEPKDCPTLRLGVRSLLRPSTVRQAWRFARFLRRERIDVVQVMFPDSTYFAVPVARLAGVPRIVRARRNLGYWMKPIDRLLGRVVSRLVDVTLTNCEACRKAVIRQEGARPESVVVLENGIDMEPFLRIPAPAVSENGRPRRVGMVANLRPVKGTDVFARAAAIVRSRRSDVVFEIAGAGDDAGLVRLAERLGVRDHLRLAGHVADVPQFLGRLDVAVLTSHSEGLSNALIEYMAAGRPIVATAVGGNFELIEDGVHGLLVRPGDPHAMAAAVERLLRDRELAARLSAAARARALERYSLHRATRDFEQFCGQLVWADGS